ncbi:MAG: hypothetical protein INR71_00290 [Terriglobus roseus]|nr:hypothetical protein [Terriglobus roseus]
MPAEPMDVAAGNMLDPGLIISDGDRKRSLAASEHATELPAFYDGVAVEQSSYLPDNAEDMPTEEELRTLRRVPDHIPIKVYTIAFVELVERLSYYGTTQVSLLP